MVPKEKRKYIVNLFLERDILIPGDFIDFLKDDNIVEKIFDIIKEKEDITLSVLSDAFFESIDNKEDIEIEFNYTDDPQKKTIDTFILYFMERFRALESILIKKPELQNVTSIFRILQKKSRENITSIGLVRDKHITKNGNLMITIEDPTGAINMIVNKSKMNLFNIAKNIVLDEVIGVLGVNGDRIIFANNIIFPEISGNKELKKSLNEEYAVFLSDLHIGSIYFLKEKFMKFIKWINREVGTKEQKEVASKVKYIFIVGDLVDGIGIYPGQEDELEQKDIYEQYEECAKYLSMIPKNIRLIISPGNHDAMRIAEPQPPLYDDFSEAIYKLPNAIILSNPAMIKIGKHDGFEGFNVLLYHGFSFDYYIANVEEIRNSGGYDRADLIMKFLLQKRHLAPTYGSTQLVPTIDKDNLVISKVPDFFVTGHLHKCSIPMQKNVNYKNITLISGSCWQRSTPFQIKLGHNPEPAKVPIVNLQTREVKILNFDRQ